MKVVILAGGLGTRISEYTKTIPKPMIKICGKPIIHRIIDHYIKYGHLEFYIALGYKGNVIKNYFKKKKFNKKIKIHLIDTGKNTMTGGRLKRLKKYLNETFLLTYGDGVSNINIRKLLNFHLKNNKNKIIKNLFNYFFSKKKQKEIFKNFYLNKTQIKEMRKNGMIIGGHSFSHKLLSNLDFKTQKIEITKNVKHLNKVIKYSMAYFAFPYGGKACFNKNTIKILKNNNIDYIFNTGNKSFSKKFKNFNDIPRFNCNKFKYGKIFKYQS